jgi:hypothetical protein
MRTNFLGTLQMEQVSHGFIGLVSYILQTSFTFRALQCAGVRSGDADSNPFDR